MPNEPEKWLSTDTAQFERDEVDAAKTPKAPNRLSLMVVTGNMVRSYFLPQEGSAVIGRSPDSAVTIDDASVSRQHARIHIGNDIEIEDLGSSNGTAIQGRMLKPNIREKIDVGDVIELASATLVIKEESATRLRRFCHHGYFENRVEEECTRASRSGGSCAVLRVNIDEAADPQLALDIFSSAVRSIDIVGIYGPGLQYEALLVDTNATDARLCAHRVVEDFSRHGMNVATGLATLEEDGNSPETLMAKANARVRGNEDAPDNLPSSLVLSDPEMVKIFDLIKQVAVGKINVLLLGETGVGKEVLADAVHRSSKRAEKSFVRINCAALTETLLESELFGHERGAFTGATHAKPGLLEKANGGTVLLDEVGEIPLSTQAKLLRVIEAQEILRVGSVEPKPTDVRFVSATNRDLEAEVKSGRFREDLYYRLAGVTISIPPLRRRPSEIQGLAKFFVREACVRDDIAVVPRIMSDAMEHLLSYNWPGNIRELRNMMDRAVLLASEGSIMPQHLPLAKMVDVARTARKTDPNLQRHARVGAPTGDRPIVEASPRETPDEGHIVVEEPTLISRPQPAPTNWQSRPADRLRKLSPEEERNAIVAALNECGGNQSQAAKLLGISRRTLINRIEKYDIPRPRKQ